MPRKKKETLKRRADGRYRCKYQGVYFYGATPEQAFAARDAYKASQAAGFSARQTVQDYALPWLERTFPKVAEPTYTGLAIHLQHLIDCIGDKFISHVVPSDIKDVYSSQYRDCSNSYIKGAKQLYCSLFDSAVADGLCRSNPARDRTAKPHRGNDTKTRPITAQEREWINTYCHDHRAYPAVILMLYAGLRPQEAKAFNIDRDYDKEKGVIRVTETAHRDGSNQYRITGKGKTKLAIREIPAFPPVVEALEGRHGALIASAAGKRITQTTWNNAFASYKAEMERSINGLQRRWYGRTRAHRAMIAAGKDLPEWIQFDIVPYDLRHSFCTMCRDAGVEINTCRKWMGHADSKMILKVYDSVSEDRSTSERQKVEKALFGGQNGGQEENLHDEKPTTAGDSKE